MENDLYAEFAALLGTQHEGQPFPWGRRNRWNNRIAGRGRFPGHGIIRIFGDVVHFAIHHPGVIRATVPTRESVAFLRERLAEFN
ncbi:MAG: hypothetical protein EOO77_14510 [Oxalobacteraceae bacterium]|jgi:hypothetical protein|nr:MAG: hypothetical protein EOO77_14510 [Oxalobacteraceae bacterium]